MALTPIILDTLTYIYALILKHSFDIHESIFLLLPDKFFCDPIHHRHKAPKIKILFLIDSRFILLIEALERML